MMAGPIAATRAELQDILAPVGIPIRLHADRIDPPALILTENDPVLTPGTVFGSIEVHMRIWAVVRAADPAATYAALDDLVDSVTTTLTAAGWAPSAGGYSETAQDGTPLAICLVTVTTLYHT